MIADYEKRNNRPYIALQGGGPIPTYQHRTTERANGHSVPLTLVNLAITHSAGYKFTPLLLKAKEKLQQKAISDIKLPDFLLEYQRDGVKKMLAKSKGALLADEPGLGKTVQLLCYTAQRPDLRPTVIVCPAHLKHTWYNETKKFYPDMRVEILSGRTPYQPLSDIVIINYEILSGWVPQLKSTKLVICDEAHRIKNREAKCTKAVLAIGTNPVRLFATGTPIVNDPENVWALVDAIYPDYILGKQVFFNSFFMDVEYKPIFKKNGAPLMKYGRMVMRKVVKGTRNLDILHKTLTTSVMIRRTKEQVLKDLPDKRRSVIPVDVNLKELNAQVTLEMQKSKSGAQRSAVFAKLYSATGKAKLPSVIAWIEDYLESTDKPLVVMGWHRDVTVPLHQKFKKESVLVIGGVTDKEDSIQKFKSGNKRVLIGNIQAAGTGLTLVNADTMLFAELPLTPADLNQAMDRIHRIGQNNKCNYYFMVGKDTLEEPIVDLLDRKATIASHAIDGTPVDEMLGDILYEVTRNAQ
jgi:SWI/SNF-related matrix-associated actin-dependent regulator 1 of chromatin subfamily A